MHIENNDTLFCFSMQQARVLAKQLVRGLYCDSIVVKLGMEADTLQQLQADRDSTIKALKTEYLLENMLVNNQKASIAELTATLSSSHALLRRERRQKQACLFGMLVLSGLAIVFNHSH